MQQRNRYKQNQRKTHNNTLALEIVKISEKLGFESNSIISLFYEQQISSADWALDKFNTKKKFVNQFCQKKCNIKIAGGTLIKLWDYLNSRYNISRNSPCYSIPTDTKIYDEKSLVFISKKSTQFIIKNHLIKEPFTTTARLYQYLNWTIRINKINAFIHFFTTSTNGITIMIINSELHNKNDEILYILCIKNDITTTKAQKFQFVQLLTEKELQELTTRKRTELLISGFIRCCLGSVSSVSGSISCIPSHISQLINKYNPYDSVHKFCVNLPLGARHTSHQFQGWRDHTLLTKQEILKRNIKKSRYQQLRSVQTGHDKRKRDQAVLQVTLNQFYGVINTTLDNNDIRCDLIPIVSILTGKRYDVNGDYSIDQILPVQINDNWIGVIYRNGLPMSTLIDKYDIINKAILCDPSYDKHKLDFFVNNVTKIEIGENCQSLCHNNNSMTSISHGYETNEIYDFKSPVYDPNPTPPVYEGNNTGTDTYTYNMNTPMDGYITTATTATTTPATNVGYYGYITTATTTPATKSNDTNVNGVTNNGTNITAATFNPTSTLLVIDEGHAMTETKHEILVTAASTPNTVPPSPTISMTNSQPMVYNNTNNIINNNVNIMNSQPLMTNMIGNAIALPVLPSYPFVYCVSPISSYLPAGIVALTGQIQIIGNFIYQEAIISTQPVLSQSIVTK